MRITSKLSKSMNKINEDVICYGKDYAFILDGHTTDEDGSRITKWYGNLLKRELKKNIDNANLLNALNKTIKTASMQFKNVFPNENVPAMTACILREKNEKIEILIVGNAKCLVQTKKIELVEDPRMDRVENHILVRMQKIKEQEKINMIEARKKINKILTETRSKVNNMGGYPAIKDRKLDETDVVYKEYSYSDVISAVICSDGFYAYKSYLKIKDKDLYDVINNQGLSHCYKHIRRMEQNDTSLTIFPRLSTYDDVSVIHIVFY